MVATGKMMIPVELLRRSCRRQVHIKPEDAAIASKMVSDTIRVKEEPLQGDGEDAPLDTKQACFSPKIEVKHELTKSPERQHEPPTRQPDGFLDVDQDELDLERTLMGGQSFRWKMTSNTENESGTKQSDPTVFTGVVGNQVMQLWRCNHNQVAYRRLNKDTQQSKDLEQFLSDYFQLQHKLKDHYEEWSRKDDHFKRSSINYRGFRILRQDPVENLFSFICATNNNIKRISLMIDKMCQQFGDNLEVSNDFSSEQQPNATFHSFPSVERLAHEDVFDSLRYKLGFGYRAKFICETAKKLVTMSSDAQMTPRDYLLNLRQLPYRDTCKRLQEFPGIGRKVADCICLMSMDHLGSVPIDCHIYEIVCRNYMKTLRQERKTLTEGVHDLIGDYFTKLHGPLAGWATSVLFIGELKHLKQEGGSSGSQSSAKKARPNKRQKKG